jgi:hypothetical protein
MIYEILFYILAFFFVIITFISYVLLTILEELESFEDSIDEDFFD